MYYITVEDLIRQLEDLPKGTKITSVGRGYFGSKQYLTINSEGDKAIKEVYLRYTENK